MKDGVTCCEKIISRNSSFDIRAPQGLNTFIFENWHTVTDICPTQPWLNKKTEQSTKNSKKFMRDLIFSVRFSFSARQRLCGWKYEVSVDNLFMEGLPLSLIWCNLNESWLRAAAWIFHLTFKRRKGLVNYSKLRHLKFHHALYPNIQFSTVSFTIAECH